MSSRRSGPLAGVRVVEFAGIGPGPLCGMLLADMGAEVLLIERSDPGDLGMPRPRRYELAHRGKASLRVDLKSPEGLAAARALVAAADVVIEGFRPGVMERLGLGPEDCGALNERLVYARITGYGQSGPMRHVAGHDLNYIALSGALSALGRAGQPPTPPMNLLGDYAGGSMCMAFGIACALRERGVSGKGQTIDASMVEGAGVLMAPFFGLYAAGMHDRPRGQNLLDTGAPFYDVYRCADGRFVAFAAIERKFRLVFARKAGVAEDVMLGMDDPAAWAEGKALLTRLFATRSQRAWCELLEGSDACITPVLDHEEVDAHPHHAARRSFVRPGGICQPAPAPRFSRTPGGISSPPPEPGAGGQEMARAWGVAV
ncbi:MAG: CoA transferase [Variovorax sp.]|nr:CoA transferase [Variovorax sp.]